jgi:hypothetical protein
MSGTGAGRPAPTVPLRGLAVCPLCCNEPAYRQRCRLCAGAGFIPRAARNAYKLGRLRP